MHSFSVFKWAFVLQFEVTEEPKTMAFLYENVDAVILVSLENFGPHFLIRKNDVCLRCAICFVSSLDHAAQKRALEPNIIHANQMPHLNQSHLLVFSPYSSKPFLSTTWRLFLLLVYRVIILTAF